MKKEELRAALHQVKPDEDLIRRTLDGIHEQNGKTLNPSHPRAYGYRIVAAICTLALIIGLGLFSHGYLVFSPASNSSDTASLKVPQSTDIGISAAAAPSAAVYTGEDASDSLTLEDAVAQLHIQAAQISSEWVLMQGSVRDIYFQYAENDVSVCLVALRVVKVWECSEDAAAYCQAQGEDITAEIRFTDELEMECFADTIGSGICTLLTLTDAAENPPTIAGYLLYE